MSGMQVEPIMGQRPRVLLAAAPVYPLTSAQDYLEERGCFVLWHDAAEDLAKRVSGLSPHLLVISQPSLLELLDRCRMVRGVSTAPLLVIGQRDVEEDEVLCLEYGADNYLGPQATPRRMRAHLTALLRRGLGELRVSEEPALTFGEVRIDARRHRVYRGERELELSQKEYALLIYLVENAGRAISRQALADYVWGASATGESRSLDVHIHWLREKLEADAGNPRHIRTVRGVGYCFEP